MFVLWIQPNFENIFESLLLLVKTASQLFEIYTGNLQANRMIWTLTIWNQESCEKMELMRFWFENNIQPKRIELMNFQAYRLQINVAHKMLKVGAAHKHKKRTDLHRCNIIYSLRHMYLHFICESFDWCVLPLPFKPNALSIYQWNFHWFLLCWTVCKWL